MFSTFDILQFWFEAKRSCFTSLNNSFVFDTFLWWKEDSLHDLYVLRDLPNDRLLLKSVAKKVCKKIQSDINIFAWNLGLQVFLILALFVLSHCSKHAIFNDAPGGKWKLLVFRAFCIVLHFAYFAERIYLSSFQFSFLDFSLNFKSKQFRWNLFDAEICRCWNSSKTSRNLIARFPSSPPFVDFWFSFSILKLFALEIKSNLLD